MSQHSIEARTRRRGHPYLRAVVRTAAPLLGALLCTALLVPTASADASGCTPVGNHRVKGASPNNVCIQVEGDGLRVDKATVDFAAPVGGVNNVVLRITFFDVNRTQVEQHVSRLYSGTRTYEKFEITPRKDYPVGRVCGSITENGVERPGACVGIHD